MGNCGCNCNKENETTEINTEEVITIECEEG